MSEVAASGDGQYNLALKNTVTRINTRHVHLVVRVSGVRSSEGTVDTLMNGLNSGTSGRPTVWTRPQWRPRQPDERSDRVRIRRTLHLI